MTTGAWALAVSVVLGAVGLLIKFGHAASTIGNKDQRLTTAEEDIKSHDALIVVLAAHNAAQEERNRNQDKKNTRWEEQLRVLVEKVAEAKGREDGRSHREHHS